MHDLTFAYSTRKVQNPDEQIIPDKGANESMRFLTVQSILSADATLELREYTHPLNYAILSHVWTDDEVLSDDIHKGTARSKAGFGKLHLAAAQARRDRLDLIWIDTACIDKSSSAELQESINSMFKWYQESKRCYVYLQDVDLTKSVEASEQISSSRWFTRGWTLQELLAPSRVLVFDVAWRCLGDLFGGTTDSNRLVQLFHSITGIATHYLRGNASKYLSFPSVAERMKWASSRRTTRDEDIAYCLMGIFDVNMPLLYGEGAIKAFIRLQEGIMKQSDDHSLFHWTVDSGMLEHDTPGLLAYRPSYFRSVDISWWNSLSPMWSNTDPYELTGRGIRIRLPLKHVAHTLYVAMLDAGHAGGDMWPGVFLRRVAPGKQIFARVFCDRMIKLRAQDMPESKSVFIRQNWTVSE